MHLQRILKFFRLRVKRQLALVFLDTLVILGSLWLSWSARAATTVLDIEPLFLFSLLSALVYFFCNFAFGLYHRIWEHASSSEVLSIATSSLAATLGLIVMDLIWNEMRPLPASVILMTGFFAFAGFVAVRYRSRVWTNIQWRYHAFRAQQIPNRERVLIFGAGEAGVILARRFLTETQTKQYNLIGFIDDDPQKQDMKLQDLPILGDRYKIPSIVSKFQIDLLIIAIYSISGEEFRRIIEICERTPARIKVLPDLFEFLQSFPDVPPIRDISTEDLLGRKAVVTDELACRKLLAARRVLVTGAAGSIGSELCRQILSYGPSRLLLLDNNESGLYELCNSLERIALSGGSTFQKETKAERIRSIVCSVTNRSKMNYVFQKFRPEIVFHAAAYKHVPLMEEQPDEAVWVNVLGTKNLVELSKEYGVTRFVFVSTDKAVRPVSFMGATKWLGELMIMNPEAWTQRPRNAGAQERRISGTRTPATPTEEVAEDGKLVCRATLFTAVRFGNVLSSRGSVVPAFEQQIKAGGPVLVTHPEMTRYFMSITEAVSLIIQAATLTNGQDIFMLNMGEKIRIDELARRLIRLRGARPDIDIPIVYTGVRPGEKLHEELLGPKETRQPTQHPSILRINKNHVPSSYELADQVDELLKLGKAHKIEDLVERLQEFIARQDEPVAFIATERENPVDFVHLKENAVKLVNARD
jgi:FlaA1/EpsC-like NDP-sugar epimerase